MTDCKSAKLTNRTILRITGTDADNFLKTLITNDVHTETNDQPNPTLATCFAGLLTPQGKILFDFFVIKDAETFYLDTNADLADDLIKRLTFYKLRADVEITSLKESHDAIAIWNTDRSFDPPELNYQDPRLPALGLRYISDKSEPAIDACTQVDEADYHAHRIALAVPEGGLDYKYGDTFPHEACFDQLGGVDFRKGCFVGQEVVSRMQHRGTARKRILHVSADQALPAAGTEILAGDKPIGTLGSSADANGLALVRLDRAARAIDKGDKLTVANTPINLALPDWADYEMISGKTE